jgi:arabinose-5-phosphate isomerase
MSAKLAGAVSIVDDCGKLIGLVTDYDIRKQLENDKNIFSMTIDEIMNKEPVYVYEDEKAYSALELMQKRARPITIIPVLNRKDIVVGMLRMYDLVKEGL